MSGGTMRENRTDGTYGTGFYGLESDVLRCGLKLLDVV
jgi:hypothetical protein